MLIKIDDRQIIISDADYEWFSERCNTTPSGSVSFTPAAIKRYRNLTGQEYEPAWKIRHQMLNEFGDHA